MELLDGVALPLKKQLAIAIADGVWRDGARGRDGDWPALLPR
jgi:hypothetical protein